MASPARGWFTPEGKPRYEVREALGSAEGDDFHRAWDRMSEREVLLVVGGESLLARANLAGRLEHPAAVTVYDVGRDPEGKVFLAAMDHTVARPLSKCLSEMTRDEVLRAVVTVAHAAAHAEGRGVLHPRLDLDQVLLFPDGHFRVIGWDEPGERHDSAARGVQKLLRRAIVPYGKAPKPLWSIVRHEYKDAGQLARDLGAYLDGASTLRATKLPLRQRLAAWGHRRPALATVLAGSGLVLVLILLGSAAFYLLHKREEAQRGEIEDRAEAQAIEAALLDAREKLPELEKIDLERLTRLMDREKLYHDTEQRRPTDEEISLDGELARLSRERTGLAQTVEVALQGAGHDPRVLDFRLAIEKGRLEWLFAYAGYEERKTLSTRTLDRARETRPVGEALLACDISRARKALRGVAEKNPFRLAAEALVETLGANPGWASELSELAAILEGDGELAVTRLPDGASVSLAPIERDAEERWKIGEERHISGRESQVLAMGNYLVKVAYRGNDFLFEVLLERAEFEEIDAREIPDGIPKGFVWIPAATTLYIGGNGRNATRYRRTRVERAFLIGRTEVTFREFGSQLEGSHSDWPVVNVTQRQALEFCLKTAPAGWTGDLPSETEWELAARGVAGREFPWGDKYLPKAANTLDFQEVPRWTSAGVPETDRSIFGVSGLAGNVLEWTSSPFVDGSNLLGIKGGYPVDGEPQARVSARLAREPASPGLSHGFREVLRK
ncbi:MAG: SUMF1/EgtB/PvdO family nonheme iron enzyme [Planctomycetes bacterium]|nr:SUMF1/EgtB/PvdO family nonheme iron enzyme [Planctomycetota bacterium]